METICPYGRVLIFFDDNNRYDYYKITSIQEEQKWKIQCRFWETSFPK